MSSLNKHKILLVITQAEWGGAQKYVFDLAVNLSVENYQVKIAVGEPDGKQELTKKLQTNKIPVFQLKHLIRKISLIQDILAIKELINLIKKEQPAILHLNSSKAGLLGAIAGRLSGKNQPAVVFTAHGWAFMEPLPFYKFWMFMLMEKIAACWRQATIVLSEKEKQIALKYHLVNPTSVIIIPNGIETNRISFLKKEEAKKKLGIFTQPDGPIIGTIANFYPTKGLEYLIEAINILKEKNNFNGQCFIIGDGAGRENLENKIKKAGLYHEIKLLGTIPEAKIYLKAFDIFVLPSIKEGLPFALLEAMSAGLPIIATQVGAIPEIITDGVNGRLVTPSDSTALATTIAEVISNTIASALMGEATKAKSRQFNFKTTLAATEKLYSSLL